MGLKKKLQIFLGKNSPHFRNHKTDGKKEKPNMYRSSLMSH
jgi:hypothetical protein